jgi:hypothetical protein
MSAYTGDEIARRGPRIEGIALPPKPLSLASLTEKVHAVLDG